MSGSFAEVIFPFPFRENLTYHIPENLESEAVPGKRVLVSLGKNRNYPALIAAIHTGRPGGFVIKDIEAVLDQQPVVHPRDLGLWRWLAGYYACTIGEVMKAALPGGFKLDRYKPKTLPLVILHPEFPRDEETWKETLEKLKRSPRQKALLEIMGRRMDPFSPEPEPGILKSELLGTGDFSEATLKQLILKKILDVIPFQVSRIPGHTGDENLISRLSEAQEQALGSVREEFSERQVVLLHGISASGKTEIYLHLIREELSSGRQVLYLVPGISLTPQIEERLVRVFGNRVVSYHSEMSDAERIEVWNQVLSGGGSSGQTGHVILGTRSSVFLPFPDLGLIIVDDEHDSAYKQSESSPRYHARDMAVVLGSLHKCRVLLSSATPSFESYFNAHTGKYGLVSLTERYGKTPVPEVVIADVSRARKRRVMQSVFTPELIAGMQKALEQGEQIVLFQDRRGYSSYLECSECGHVPVCVNCDISLTTHLNLHQMVCHYCGYHTDIPAACPVCGSGDIKNRGFGTEMVETDIHSLFPDARVSRMDTDTARSRNAFQKITKALEQKKTDILIGTRMVIRGLNPGNAGLAGVLNADILLNHSDFRSTERTFQMLCQVAGLTGSSLKQGKVIIQTSRPDHPVFRFIREPDFTGFFNELVAERKSFSYPPWVRLIKIILKHKDPVHLESMAALLAEKLRKPGLFRVLGPESPAIGRVKNQYIREIWLKIPKELKNAEIREILLKTTENIRHLPGNNRLILYADVDPV